MNIFNLLIACFSLTRLVAGWLWFACCRPVQPKDVQLLRVTQMCVPQDVPTVRQAIVLLPTDSSRRRRRHSLQSQRLELDGAVMW
jgi:hypothetical protein